MRYLAVLAVLGIGVLLVLGTLADPGQAQRQPRQSELIPPATADYLDATPYLRTDWDCNTGEGSDNAPGLSRAIADAAARGITEIRLPAGYIGLKTPVVWPDIGRLKPINLSIRGRGPARGPYFNSQWKQANCTILFEAGGHIPFDFSSGGIGITLAQMTIEGLGRWPSEVQSPPNPLPPALVRLLDPAGFGAAQCTLDAVDLCDAPIGLQLGAAGQNNCDTMLCRRVGFIRLARGFVSSNDQSLCCTLRDCGASQCPTIAHLERGGSFGIDCMAAQQCGSGCPPIPARPKPGDDDWMIRLGPGGWNAAAVQINRLRAEVDSGQAVRVDPGGSYRQIVFTAYEQIAGASPRPLYSLRGNSTLTFRDCNLSLGGATLGDSEKCPVRFESTIFWNKAPPGQGAAPLFRDCSIQMPGGTLVPLAGPRR